MDKSTPAAYVRINQAFNADLKQVSHVVNAEVSLWIPVMFPATRRVKCSKAEWISKEHLGGLLVACGSYLGPVRQNGHAQLDMRCFSAASEWQKVLNNVPMTLHLVAGSDSLTASRDTRMSAVVCVQTHAQVHEQTIVKHHLEGKSQRQEFYYCTKHWLL